MALGAVFRHRPRRLLPKPSSPPVPSLTSRIAALPIRCNVAVFLSIFGAPRAARCSQVGSRSALVVCGHAPCRCDCRACKALGHQAAVEGGEIDAVNGVIGLLANVGYRRHANAAGFLAGRLSRLDDSILHPGRCRSSMGACSSQLEPWSTRLQLRYRQPCHQFLCASRAGRPVTSASRRELFSAATTIALPTLSANSSKSRATSAAVASVTTRAFDATSILAACTCPASTSPGDVQATHGHRR